MNRRVVIASGLVSATVAVYWPVIGFEFVNFDDTVYITENPAVRAGLSAKGVLWAFTSGHAANWHPVTWLSHMLDVSVFGLSPGAHHAVNLLLHLANTLLLFELLVRMTGREGSSGVVALLFAIHPLHVESVAWISERKDLLSAFFGFLTMLAYVRYTASRKSRDYTFAALFLALGLMAKPMLVTLPFVLLLLDFWPLKRWHQTNDMTFHSLVREKLPLFALSAVSGVLTLVVQRAWGAMEIGHAIAFPERITNALVSYVRYIAKTILPLDLSLLYPHPDAPGGLPWSTLEIAASLTLLFAITACVFLWRAQRHLIVGWLWFAGMLVPVIGIVQVGGQAMADRYTYLPLIGLFIMVTYGPNQWIERRSARRFAGLSALAVVACVLAFIAHQQTLVWRDSLTLLRHAATITPGNPIIDNHYGLALQKNGQLDEAIRHYRRALMFDPKNAITHSNLGRAVHEKGHTEEAIAHYRRAIDIASDYTSALSNLGAALADQGRLSEATSAFERALETAPDSAKLHANLATVLRIRGEYADAIAHYGRSVELAPDSAATHHGLGVALLDAERPGQARISFERALAIEPDFPGTQAQLSRAIEAIGAGR